MTTIDSKSTLAITVRDAVDITRAWWDEHALLTDLNEGAVQSDLDAVVAAAASAGHATLGDLLHNARSVIATITGVDKPSAFTTPSASHHVHRVRNTIGAMLTACEQSLQEDARPLDLLFRLPLLSKRAGGDERPLTDDEVILMRSDALLCLKRDGRERIPAVQYALSDIGARPYETTQVTPDDFDNPRDPTSVQVHGSGHLAKPRRLAINAWARPVLARALDVHLAIHPSANYMPVGYGGRTGAYSASASAAGVISRAMRRAGLGTTVEIRENWHKRKGTEPTPMAIARWRVGKALDADGPVEALKIMGRFDPRNIKVGLLEDFLNRTTTTEVDDVPEERVSFKGL